MSSDLTPDRPIFTNRTPHPDSPLHQLATIEELVTNHCGDGFSKENWQIVEQAMDRLRRIVVAADKWAHAYESCSSAPVEKWLFEAVRGYYEVGVPYRTEWGTTEVIEFEDPPIGPEDWEFFA